jgi:anthranilate phosphoribosyltransferase
VEHLIERLINDQDVETAELKRIFGELCEGRPYPPEQLAALLVLMRARSETAEQLAGLAETILEQAVPIDVPPHATTIGGTGGDYAGTFNISTAAALLTAACGVPVAKHGNRAVSSQCGSGDVLEALGIPVDLGPDDAQRILGEHGFVYLAAPVYLPAFKYIAPVRAALKVPTIFNIIGPLLHPGHLKRQIIGVFDRSLQDGRWTRLAHPDRGHLRQRNRQWPYRRHGHRPGRLRLRQVLDAGARRRRRHRECADHSRYSCRFEGTQIRLRDSECRLRALCQRQSHHSF